MAPAFESSLSTRSVPVIAPPSTSAFRGDWVRPRRPVVLKGMAREVVPAVGRWTPELLGSEFGSVEVPVARTRDGRVVVDRRVGVVCDRQPLRAFIDRMRSATPSGYVTVRTDELPERMSRELELPAYCAGRPWLVCKLWISTAGTVSALHRDLADNLHLLVHGSKRFTLVAPSEGPGVYPAGWLSSIPNLALVDVERPDFDRFPRLREVHLQVAELEPGDAVYIPRFWWHHVRSLEASISANWFFASGGWAGLAFAADLAKRVRGISR